jgi:hypothetical protein
LKNKKNHIDELFNSKLNERNFDLDEKHLDDFNQQLNKHNSNFNPIDSLFKKKLLQRDFPFDVKHLNALKKQLSKFNASNFKKWYWAASILLGIGITSLVYFTTNTINSKGNIIKKFNTNESVVNKTNKSSKKQKSTELNNLTKSENPSRIKKLIGNDKKVTKETASKDFTVQNTNKVLLRDDSLTNTNLNNENKKSLTTTHALENKFYSNPIVKENDLLQNVESKDLINVSNDINNTSFKASPIDSSQNSIVEWRDEPMKFNIENPIIDNGSSGSQNDSETIINIDTFNTSTDSLKKIEEDLKNITNLSSDSLNKDLVKSTSDSLVQDSVSNNPDSLLIQISEFYDSIKPDKKWSLSFSIGSNLIMKKSSILNPNQGMSPTVNQSLSSTINNQIIDNNIFNIPLDLRINYKMNKSFSISSGLSTVSFGEKIDYNNIHETNMVYDSNFVDTICIIGTFHVPFYNWNTGQTDTAIYNVTKDTTYWERENYEETRMNNYKVQNRYTYLNIPFMVGYEFSVKKFRVSLKTGGAIGFRINNSMGMYYNKNIQDLHPFEMKKTIFNIVTTASIGYQLNKLEIFLEPKYWLNITNSMNSSDLNHKYHLFGGNIGVQFKL